MPKLKEIARIIKEDSKQGFEELMDSAQEAKIDTCPCGKYKGEVVVNNRCHICGEKNAN